MYVYVNIYILYLTHIYILYIHIYIIYKYIFLDIIKLFNRYIMYKCLYQFHYLFSPYNSGNNISIRILEFYFITYSSEKRQYIIFVCFACCSFARNCQYNILNPKRILQNLQQYFYPVYFDSFHTLQVSLQLEDQGFLINFLIQF